MLKRKQQLRNWGSNRGVSVELSVKLLVVAFLFGNLCKHLVALLDNLSLHHTEEAPERC